MNNIPKLYIVVPCFNEEQVLPITAKIFLEELQSLINKELISEDSRILFVDDGSKDKTWNIVFQLAKENKYFEGIGLSKNRGHQNALLAGLMEVADKCDIAVSVDCDGQDDISVIEKMVCEYNNGKDIVYGARSKRDKDSFFKRFTAENFYRLLKFMGVDTVYNHADFRLVSAKVLKELSEFKEVNLFLRGIFPFVGFNSSVVYYERENRIAGNSHYPIFKMLALAVEGITSFSIQPLRLILVTGIFISLLSLIGILWACTMYVKGNVIAGWASLICSIFFIGGIQTIFLGIIGEYLGKIYLETKHRPRYIINKRT